MGEALDSHNNSTKYYCCPYFTTEETEAEASFFPVPQPPFLVSIPLSSRLLTLCLLPSLGHLLQRKTSPTPALIPLRVQLPAGLASHGVLSLPSLQCGKLRQSPLRGSRNIHAPERRPKEETSRSCLVLV